MPPLSKKIKWIPKFFWPNFLKFWSKLNGFEISGLAFPLFMVVIEDYNLKWELNKKRKYKKLINHESIHIYQQLETFIIGFFILYTTEYLIKLIVYRNHQIAYKAISFEKEAFSNESNLRYLEERKLFSWIRYIF